MRRTTVILLISLLPLLTFAEEGLENFGIKFSGYVKTDFMFDTRQTVSAREGQTLFWPAAPDYDLLGNDINAKSKTTFLAVQTRLAGKISGPDAFGAKTSALIETDFFGQANQNINLLRIRHAYILLNWKNSSLLFGQYWTPMFIASSYPGTVSFNTGLPIQPFGRNPQIRYTQHMGNFSMIITAMEQRDHASRGVNGMTGEYLRNAVVPDMHFQITYNKKYDSGKSVATGLGVQAKTIKPRLSSPENYQVDESLFSKSFNGFLKVKSPKMTYKFQGVYAENIPEALTFSGFAVKHVKNPVTGEQEYTPLKNVMVWTDIHTNGDKWNVGLFAGINSNLGTKDKISSPTNEVYGFGTDIKRLYRVSPRVTHQVGKVRLALEFEYTNAEFGVKEGGIVQRDLNALPLNTESVANLRSLFAVFYFF